MALFTAQSIYSGFTSVLRRARYKLRVSRRTTIYIISAFLISTAVFLSYGYLESPGPTITITTPEDGASIEGGKLFVKGSVVPAGANVFVNGKEVAKNGDGTFTAVITIPTGKTILMVNANYRGKNSSLQRLVERALTESEQAKKKAERELAQIKAKQEVINTDQRIEEILGAYSATVEPKSVKVLSHELKTQAGLKRVVGEVMNGVPEEVFWVRITASFYDKDDNVVDTKVGFSAQFDKSIGPFDIAKFETASTGKEFAYYKLSVDWRTSSNLTDPVEDEKETSVSSKTASPEPSDVE